MDTVFDALNGVRFALCLSLMFVFGHYLFINRHLVRSSLNRLNYIQAAIAFFIYESGETVWRSFVWWNHGDARAAFLRPHLYYVFIFSGIVAAVGSLCCLRVLLPELWTWPTWTVIMVFVAGVLFITLT